MKKITLHFLTVVVFVATAAFYSCNSKARQSADTPAATTPPDTSASVTPPSVTIASDDVLKQGVRDAVKDFPNVKADVSDSVINLSGEIRRADWQKLNPTLNSLHPKRINSTNLTIK